MKAAGYSNHAALLLAVCVTFSACGGSSGAADLAQPDLAVALDGCRGLARCLAACGPPVPGDDCAAACTIAAKPSGQSLYSAAVTCADSYCVAASKCVWNSTMTQLLPPPLEPQSYCDDCVFDAESSLSGNACKDPNSAACKQMQCAQPYQNCLKDVP